jgi:RNA polymerase sigma-70 factor, ECF subfamily
MTTTAIQSIQTETEFEEIFKTSFKNLHSYAFTILKNMDMAEEAVQQIFLKLWEQKDILKFDTSVKAYLYKAVHNHCLNVLKHEKVKNAYKIHSIYQMKNHEDSAHKKIAASELEIRLHKALNELPEQCRTIFQLSRFDELTYREIADQMGLSVKTIENQMGKALKILRIKLVDFLLLIYILSFSILNK